MGVCCFVVRSMLGASVFGFCGFNGWLILKYGFFFVWIRKCFYSLIESFVKYLGFEYGIFVWQDLVD